MQHKDIIKFGISASILTILIVVLSQGFAHAAKPKHKHKPIPTTTPEQADKNERLHIIYTGMTKKTTSIYLISALEKISGSEGTIKVTKATFIPSMRIKNLCVFSNVGQNLPASLGSSYEDVIKKFVPQKKVEVLSSNFDLLFASTELKYPLVDKIRSYFAGRNLPSLKTEATIGKVTGTNGKVYDAILLDDPNAYANDIWQAQTCFKYLVSINGVSGEVVSFGNFYGGYSSLLPTLEEEIKQSKSDVLLLDTGGSFGEYGFKYVEPLFKLLQYDAILPGINDLSNEYDSLIAAKDKLPLVNSNLFEYGTDKPLFKDHLIITKDGVRVGIIGLVSPGHTPKGYIKDPVEAATSILKKIGDKIDVCIALTDLTPKELSELENVPGLSMILGKNQDDVPPFPVRYTQFRQRNDSLLRSSYFTGAVGNKYFSSLKLYFQRTQNGIEEKALLWEKYPLDIYSKKDATIQSIENKSIIDSYGAKDPILLPDYRELFPDKKDKDFIYSAEEASTLMANVLLLETDADVAIYTKKSRLSSSVTGGVSESIIRSWFHDKNESVVITRMNGGTLMAIIGLMGQYEELKDPTKPSAVMAGINPAGMTVKNKPISSTEYYTVATTKHIFDSVDIYPPFRGLEVSDELFTESPTEIIANSDGKKVNSSDVLVSFLKQKKGESWNKELEELISIPDTGNKGPYWRINLKNISFEYRGHRVNSSNNYINVPDARVQPTDDMTISAHVDTSFELYSLRWNWETGSTLDFMNMRITSMGTTISTASQDSALVYTDYKYKIFNFSPYFFGRSLGPFINIAYDTQFKPVFGNPRKKILRFIPGLAFSDGSVLDNLRLGWILEQDFSTSPSKHEKGIYFYTDTKFMIAPIKSLLISALDLKYFFDSPTDTVRELGVELDYNLSLRVPVYRSFFVAPYFEYFLFRGKVDPIRKYGTASTVGVSLGLSEIIKP